MKCFSFETQKSTPVPPPELSPKPETDTSNTPETKASPEVRTIRKILSGLNETALKNILIQKMRKTGASATQLERYIPLSSIKVVNHTSASGALGGYNNGTILIAAKESKAVSTTTAPEYFLKREIHAGHALKAALQDSTPENAYLSSLEAYTALEDNEPEIKGRIENALLYTQTVQIVAHEQLHAFSDKGLKSNAKEKEDADQYLLVGTGHHDIGFKSSGYVYSTYTNKKTGVEEKYATDYNYGRGINEAVTQLIALDVAREYLHQNPPEGITRSEMQHFLHEANVGYTREMWIAEQLIALISVMTDVPENIVLNGLFRSYSHNESPLPDEFADVVEVTFPEDNAYAESITELFRTALLEDTFTEDSEFYDYLIHLASKLPKEKLRRLVEKLDSLDTKYVGSRSK